MYVRALPVALALFAAPTAFAGTIHVPADQPTIQKAIDVAANGDVVEVAAGTYTENIDLLGKRITLRGAGRGKSIIDGSSGGPTITMDSGENPNTIVTGFSIRGGTGKKSGSKRLGGGVYIANHSSPTIEGDTGIGFNTATYGAGIYVGKSSSPLFQDLLVANNVTANKGVGAGIYSLGSPTFDNCRIAENTATNGTGGGIVLENSKATLRDSDVDKNHALFAGGVLVKGGSPEITGNLFEENEVVGAPVNGEAGGLGIGAKGAPFVSGNVFRLNRAHTGAGIWAWDAKPIVVLNLIHDNDASQSSIGKFGYGGGIALGRTRGSFELNEIYFNRGIMGGGVATRGGTTSLLLGNLIDHNDVGSGQGGGVYSKDSAPTFLGNTIGYNAAGSGGGLFSTGTRGPTVDTSILWGNTGGADPSFFDDSGKLVIKFSDVEAAALGGFSLSIDPLFVDPASRNFRLGAGSPVVDAGNFTFGGGSNDIYGNTRVNGGRVDMGAAEQ
jgi:parallel beta-helix repeat protein